MNSSFQGELRETKCNFCREKGTQCPSVGQCFIHLKTWKPVVTKINGWEKKKWGHRCEHTTVTEETYDKVFI